PGKGDGTFGAPTLYDAGASPAFPVAGDFNKDGFLDVAVPSLSDDVVSLLRGGPTLPDALVLTAPRITGPGVPFNVTVLALTRQGAPDAAFVGTVQLTSSDPAAALPGAYTFTAADNGTHTFSVTLNTYSATQTITATDTTTGATAGTASVFVDPLYA